MRGVGPMGLGGHGRGEGSVLDVLHAQGKGAVGTRNGVGVAVGGRSASTGQSASHGGLVR